MKRLTLVLAVTALLSRCALVPVRPANQRPAPRVTCEAALGFNVPAAPEWVEVCSDGRITPKPLPWYLALYLHAVELLER